MPTRERRIQAFAMAMVWILTHIPLDEALYHCKLPDVAVYAIIAQVVELAVLSYLIFDFLENKALLLSAKITKRPWKCPVCDGWGKRIFTPGMNTETKAQLTVCSSCEGKGVVWELVIEGQR